MIRIVLGNVTFSNVEAIIIPSNCQCKLRGRVQLMILPHTLEYIENLSKDILTQKKINVGEFIKTPAYKLKRRGIKYIYQAILSDFYNSYSDTCELKKSLRNIFNDAIKNKLKSIAVPAVGYRDYGFNAKILSNTIVNTAINYQDEINIYLIDDICEYYDSNISICNTLGIEYKNIKLKLGEKGLYSNEIRDQYKEIE